jgi:hypothetical protein
VYTNHQPSFGSCCPEVIVSERPMGGCNMSVPGDCVWDKARAPHPSPHAEPRVFTAAVLHKKHARNGLQT